jgi:phosphoribosylanthranilate isomerase
LAGGVGLANAAQTLDLKQLRIHAIDVNSKFELEPGLKDIDKLSELIKILKPEEVEM